MDLQPFRSPFRGFYLFFCGLCMGTADLIPGISGGTIAFIMGFYHTLLESIKTLNSSNLTLLLIFQWKLFFQRTAWKFLLTLVSGIACAILLLSGFLQQILANEVYRVYLYACFFGLILASFVFCLRQVNVWSGKIFLLLAIGVTAAYLLTGLTLTKKNKGTYSIKLVWNRGSIKASNYDPETHLLSKLTESDLSVLLAKQILQKESEVFDESGKVIGSVSQYASPYSVSFLDGWMIICGAAAICALLLPGISGSYLLTLLGVYPVVIAALADLLTGFKQFSLDVEALAVLLNLLLGILIGAIGFARIVSLLLRHYPDHILALLSGFVIGAIQSVWPFWTYTYSFLPLKWEKGPQLVLLDPFFPKVDSFEFFAASLCALAGFASVFLIEYLANRKASQLTVA